MNSVETGDRQAKMEVNSFTWCRHVGVLPVYGNNGANNYVRVGRQGANLVIEEGLLKVVCDECYRLGSSLPSRVDHSQ